MLILFYQNFPRILSLYALMFFWKMPIKIRQILANAPLVYFRENRLQNYLSDINGARLMTSVLFISPKHFQAFQNISITYNYLFG